MSDNVVRQQRDMLAYTLQIALAWAIPKFLEYAQLVEGGDEIPSSQPYFYFNVVRPLPSIVADLPAGSVIVRFGLRTAARDVSTTVAVRAGSPDNHSQMNRRWASIVEQWGREST